MRINHNIPALRSLHQIGRNNKMLEKTMERLSSGLRINHAADDAAGLAIVQKMDTQVRGLKRANMNAMDGISLIQTAEGALNEVQSMLQRTRELAIQASNGTLTAQDRKAINDEVKQLKQEIDRISEHSEFNERKLLNGEIDRRAFSTDAKVADIVSMSDTVPAGDYSFELSQPATKTKDTGGAVKLFDDKGKATKGGIININGEQVTIKEGDSSQEVFAKLRNLSDTVGAQLTTEPPFGNDKQLTLELKTYGPSEINVTGDRELLKELGLDENHFNPNSDKMYHKQSADLSAGLTINTGANEAEEILINGVKVVFKTGDSVDDVLNKLQNANIPAVEFSKDGNKIEMYATKPLQIEPKDPTKEVPQDLKSLGMTEANKIDMVKSIPTDSIDQDAKLPAAPSNIQIMIEGSSSGIDVDLTGADFTTSAGIDAVITKLNTAVSANHTTFKYDSAQKKIMAYNEEGKQVTIEPKTSGTANDEAAAKALGFESNKVETVNLPGNKGVNAVVNVENLKYDNPTTSEVEGFPPGTTVATDGQRIVFGGPENFRMVLNSTEKAGDVTLNVLETGPLDLQIGANEGQFMQIRIQNMSTSALGLDEINLNTPEKAQEAIGIIDAAINEVSSVRSKLGAYQNRLEHTVTNLDVATENLTASLSRIQDADMAAEMAEYTQKNIISQAGTSMLAQANQKPQQILQLLQG